MMIKEIIRYLKAPLFLLLLSTFNFAQTAEEKGLTIAVEADKIDLGFKDSEAELEMILRNQHGEESTRSMRNKTLEVENDGDKSLVVFDTPKDVKGTAFLSHTHSV